MRASLDDLYNSTENKRPSLDELYESTQPKEEDSMKTMGAGGYIKEHPFKTILQPLTKTAGFGTAGELVDRTVGGAAPFQRNLELYGNNPIAKAEAFAESFTTGLAADIVDMAQTPVNYLGAGIGKVAKGASRVLGGTSARIQDAIIKLPIKAWSYSKNPMPVFEKEAVVGNNIGELVENYSKRLEQRVGELKDAVKSNPSVINIQSIINKYLDDSYSVVQKSTNKELKEKLSKQIEDLKTHLNENYDLKNMSLDDAVSLKKQLADDYPFNRSEAISSTGNKVPATAHKIHHAINEEIEKVAPEVSELNQRVSGLIDISKAAQNRFAVESRNNPLGLIGTLIGGAGGAAEGQKHGGGTMAIGMGAVGAALGYKALSSPAIMTRVAWAMSKLANADKAVVFKAAPWFKKVSEQSQKFVDEALSKSKGVSQVGEELGVVGKVGVSKADEVSPNLLKKGIEVESKDHPEVASKAPEVIPELVKDELKKNPKFYDKEEGKGFLQEAWKNKGKMAAGVALAGTLATGQAQASQGINIKSINQIESSGNPLAYNAKEDAIGLNQLRQVVRDEWNQFNPKEKYSRKDYKSEEVNNKVADWYYNKRIPQMMKVFKIKDTAENRIIAYNWGIGKLKDWYRKGADFNKLPVTTRKYIKKYRKLEGEA